MGSQFVTWLLTSRNGPLTRETSLVKPNLIQQMSLASGRSAFQTKM